VRVRMIASPINPSDLLMVRGQYAMRPTLPATPGFEGVGVVEEAGRGLLGRLRLGRRVVVLNRKSGNWQEQVVVPARQVVPIGDDIPDEQAASFFVNPATAVAMTHYVVTIPKGEWVLQTAAGSALGRMLLKLGKWAGFRTINVVRRPEQAEELLRYGGDAAICTAHESIADRIAAITAGTGVRHGLDAVGGATGSAVAAALAPGGRLLVYGTLAGEPLAIDSRTLMVGSKRVEGFWLSNWVRGQGVLTMLRLFRQINRLLGDGTFATEVGAQFPVEEIHQAVRLAEQPGRVGKVLLRIGSR